MSVGNGKVGIYSPETDEDVAVINGALNVHLDIPVDVSAVATSAKQSPLDKFGILYATEYGATYNYIAKYSATGAWIVQRETISTGIRDYAFQANQSPALDPDTVIHAFTDKATIDYGQYSE